MTEYKGLLGRDYHDTRIHHPTVKFSLQCRIDAISKGISEMFPHGVGRLLDMGSADGLLAKGIKETCRNIDHIYALDLDFELLKYNPFAKVQGSCTAIPFADNTFDVITAAALIEHLTDPLTFLRECKRILRPGGALMLTSPVPFFEWVATKMGYLKDSGHVARYNLEELRKLSENAGMKAVRSKKFMISPVRFPAYTFIESLLEYFRLSFLMLNQILICAK